MHGLETYRILAAMYVLKSFSVKDLARFSEANETTVRTVLGRHGDMVEDAPQNAPARARRGGQPKFYRLRDKQAGRLEAQLEELAATARSFVSQQGQLPPQLSIPISVLVAEDTLKRQYLVASTLEEKSRLIKIAELQVETGRDDWQELASQAPDAPEIVEIASRLDQLGVLLAVCKAQTALKAAHSAGGSLSEAEVALEDAVQVAAAHTVAAPRIMHAFARAEDQVFRRIPLVSPAPGTP